MWIFLLLCFLVIISAQAFGVQCHVNKYHFTVLYISPSFGTNLILLIFTQHIHILYSHIGCNYSIFDTVHITSQFQSKPVLTQEIWATFKMKCDTLIFNSLQCLGIDEEKLAQIVALFSLWVQCDIFRPKVIIAKLLAIDLKPVKVQSVIWCHSFRYRFYIRWFCNVTTLHQICYRLLQKQDIWSLEKQFWRDLRILP